MYRSSWMGTRGSRVRTVLRLIVAGSCLALGGCVETGQEISASTTAPVRVAARPGVSPSGAPVAIASLVGAPAPVTRTFIERTRAAAASLDVLITEPKDAKYLIRGYLDAQPGAQGTVVSYVWDVFDARRTRVQRLEDSIAVKASGADPWAGVDDAALADLAARSASDLAAVLTNMPEAVAASRAPAAAPAPRVATAPPPARVADAAASLR